MDRKTVRPNKNVFGVHRYFDIGLKLAASEKGMTLVEIMLASGISILLLSLMISTMFMVNVAKTEFGAYLDMTNKVRIVLDQMAYGVRQAGQPNRRGIAEAVSGSITAGSTELDYIDVDGVTHSIRLNNGNIEYRRGIGGAWETLMDPNGKTAAFDGTKYSTSLKFSQAVPTSAIIKLALGRLIKGRWYYASASTEIAFRNAG